jgi:NADPH:quinone reductase
MSIRTAYTLPLTMNAVLCPQPGGPEALLLAPQPCPSPGPGEVLIEVAAAGVNRPDIYQRQGKYPPPPGASPILGLEVAGQIVALGEGVEAYHLGERVCALVSGGGYARYAKAVAGHCLAWPQGYDALQAGALPETLFTVWTNLVDSARLQAGEWLLVHGGASGIGTMAIQLASKILGARVITTAGSAEKCAFLSTLGAEAAINYRSQDFVEEVKQHTQGQGVQVILDMVGADYFARNLEVLAPQGRHISISAQTGAQVSLSLSQIMRQRWTITGSTLRARSDQEKTAIRDAVKKAVWPALAQGHMRPIIHNTWPLSQVANAHRELEASLHIGKIMLAL